MKLSAIIITHNEERNIARCIDSLNEIADEIIVADSFSADKTCEIAASKGAKVFQRKWYGYGNAKNFAAQQSLHEFILSIDADEAISDPLKKSINQAKTKGLEGIYKFNRLSNYCGKWIYHCGWYPDKKIRIYPKSKAEWNNEIVHEEIIFKENLPKNFLTGDLHHYSYYSVKEHWEKAKKYAEMGAQRDLQKKNNFLLLRSFFAAGAKFLKMFFFQLGFLDGRKGFTICRISAYGAYRKYSTKQKLLKKNAR